MKKSLLSLCILGTLPVAAFAQSTATSLSNVTAKNEVIIFGVADMAIIAESGGPAGPVNKLTSGVASGSRLGFQGAHEIRPGLSAYVWLEGGLLMDTGNSAQGGSLFGRQAFAGLRGNVGSITLGRQYTPAAMVQVEMDPFITGTAGTSANLLSPGGAGGSNRMNNAIKYNAPANMGGFNAEWAYAFGEVAGNTTASSENGGNVGYMQGPFSAKAAYHTVNTAASLAQKVQWVAGKYDFGLFTGYVNFVSNRGSTVFGVPNANSSDVLLGISAPIAGGRFMVSSITLKDNTAAQRNANQFALGYDYFLDKSTDIYVSWAHINNSNAPIVVGVSGYRVGNATEQGSGNAAFTLGGRYSF